MSDSERASAPLPDVPGIERGYREVNGVELHTVTAGDPGGQPVVLLHGFPEFWYEWREYLDPLAEAGYRVVVPDQRGYNLSGKPTGLDAYSIDTLAADIVDLIETTGRESAHVVGHDWGAAVAWDLALRHPESVDRLGIVNVPHPTVFQRTLTADLTQLRNSWYMFFFQLPLLPEWTSSRNRFAFFVNTMEGGSRPGTFDEPDFERYRRAWSRADAVGSMINWYRALFRRRRDPPRERVDAPTLVVWGENDQALVPRMAEESVQFCSDGRLERFPDATHWVPHERRDRVAALLLEHLDGSAPA
ncbi:MULTISPECIES: alpha/beta fold hydrolase [Halorubrum]|uniref:Pimeloyl-ACP methyl ester carboxylesterase n=1 Tax=Halorubrum sodomense TaxID=35743 RepID=A0A1I6GVX8_HALSD|nr:MULTISPECIES: alpha/beta hydrolase [Halorubrum]TKX54751.1 alpha/beta hydrolase [Halorubrum sp. SP3]TKX69860.1 alpha/beta hydrolase [Halorubrum sp. SP9]SFR46231.1 Pimeloyl-ACP methyl ester carboxylesterase [Halorubrum sodomense]